MMPLFLVVMLGAAAGGAQPATKAPSACTRFLTGHWVGRGTVAGFGAPVKVDNDYRYNADGSFKTVNRYLGTSGRWSEQKLTGRWRATADKAPRDCRLFLAGSGTSAGSSSEATVTMVDAGTFRSQGFDMKRITR